jgi:hypothetical protein
MFDSNSVTRRRLMRILQTDARSTRAGRLLSGAVVAAAASLLLPTVRASEAASRSTAAPRLQDPDQIRKLREEIDRLQAAQEALRAKLEAMTRKARAADPAEKVETVIEVEAAEDEDEQDREDEKRRSFTVRRAIKDGPGVWVIRADGDDGKQLPARLRLHQLPAIRGALRVEAAEPGSERRFVTPDGSALRAVRLPGGARVLLLDKQAPDAERKLEQVIEIDKDGTHRVLGVLPKLGDGRQVIIEVEDRDGSKSKERDEGRDPGKGGPDKKRKIRRARRRGC